MSRSRVLPQFALTSIFLVITFLAYVLALNRIGESGRFIIVAIALVGLFSAVKSCVQAFWDCYFPLED